ncbi:MAG: hypothetical protein LBP35_04845 [Candidatus Ancillula trichonymphae]|nr:hypothetical protein [Candidatus Ancillula trichonymphae]
MQEFVAYHMSMLKFHTHLESAHAYSAKAVGWLLQLRPTSFYYKTPDDCGSSQCSAHILALGNRLIWWFGFVALTVLVAVLFCDQRSRSSCALCRSRPVTCPGFCCIRTAQSSHSTAPSSAHTSR